MPTLFSRIVSGELPAHKVAETNDFLAFMDVRPLRVGHVLVIPKIETDYLFDIDDETYIGLWVFAKIVAQGVKKAFPCPKVGVAVIGLEVNHAHIHLIPMENVGDMDFSKPKLEPSAEALASHAAAIKQAILEITGS